MELNIPAIEASAARSLPGSIDTGERLITDVDFKPIGARPWSARRASASPPSTIHPHVQRGA